MSTVLVSRPAAATSAAPRVRPTLHQARCVCRDCGAHTAALVGRSVLSGMCSCCGGHELERIGPLEELDSGALQGLGTGRLI